MATQFTCLRLAVLGLLHDQRSYILSLEPAMAAEAHPVFLYQTPRAPPPECIAVYIKQLTCFTYGEHGAEQYFLLRFVFCFSSCTGHSATNLPEVLP
jgi:hypothetical protein